MDFLELKVPPPVVTVLLFVAMWAISQAASPFDAPRPYRLVAALAIAALGIGIAVSGALSLRRARTTISPLKPEKTSSLVTSGIYRYTRNPMYLGLFLVLFGRAVYLPSDWALAGPLAFAPEERMLSGKFGEDYSAYAAKARRWV